MTGGEPQACWQLLPRPYTKQEWEQLPHIAFGHWTGNYKMETYANQKIIEIPFGSLPYLEFLLRHEEHVMPNVHLTFMNLTPDGKLSGIVPVGQKTLVQCTEQPGLTRILVMPHAVGLHAIEIISSPTTEFVASLQEGAAKQFSANAVIEYQLNVTEPPTPTAPLPNMEKFPYVYSTAKLGNFFITEPLNGQLPASTPVKFTVGQQKNPWAYANPSLFIFDKRTGSKYAMKPEMDGQTWSCVATTGAAGEPILLAISNGNSFSFLASWDTI